MRFDCHHHHLYSEPKTTRQPLNKMSLVRSPCKTHSIARRRRHKDILRRAQRNSVRFRTIVRLAVQTKPGQVPLNVELRINTDAKGDAVVELVERITKKRKIDHVEGHRVYQGHAKRKRVGEYSLLTPGTQTEKVNDHDALVLVPPGTAPSKSLRRQKKSLYVQNQDQDQDQDQEERSEEAVPRYVVDLGTIQAFPTEQDIEVLPLPIHNNHRRIYYNSYYPTLIAILIIPAAIIYFIASSYANPASSHTTLPTNFVDWFSRAAQIQVGLASISRIMLFGESSQEPHYRWRCQPGMRPPEGHNHIEPDPYKHVPWIGYKPWLTTSNGSYVSEKLFLDDFKTILDSILPCLNDIANLGPKKFLFSSRSSTQFRWSTSGGHFASPHDSLPTFTINMTDIQTPGSTVPGIGHETTPTARPPTITKIYNVDPGLTKLQQDIERTFWKFWLHHQHTYELFTGFFLSDALNWPKIMLLHLEKLRDDKSTRECLTVSSSIPDVTKRNYPKDTSIPSGIPEEYVFAAFRDSWKRAQRVKNECKLLPRTPCQNRSNRLASTTTPPPANTKSSCSSTDQTNNKLVEIIKRYIAYENQRPDDPDNYAPELGDIVPYRTLLISLCDLVDRLLDRLEQVVTNVNLDVGKSEDWNPRVTRAVMLLHEVFPFFKDIAAVRLRDMRDRASRGVWLFEELEAQRTNLGSEIAQTIADSWLNDNQRVQLPSLDTIIRDWERAESWIKAERADVIHTSEHIDLFSRVRRDKLRFGNHEEEFIIWSRWGINDVRHDPAEREALCWCDGLVGDPVWDSCLRRVGRGLVCGDVSKRHGG